MWAALQCHESRHGRAHTELARLVIARRQHAAPITSAAHAHGFAAQRGAIAHFDRSVEAIHVEMDDGTWLLLTLHRENLAQRNEESIGRFLATVSNFGLCKAPFSLDIDVQLFSEMDASTSVQTH